MTHDAVTIVGAGISGAACAVRLRALGVEVRVLDRGRAPGGRMASPLLHDRRVDLGAGYFTVRDEQFTAVVDGWAAAGLARPWTDTFSVVSADAEPERKTGPVRWATPGGLRSLVRSLLDGIEVLGGEAVTELPDGPVVLAMPDPQAARLTTVPDAVEYDPVIAVTCGYPARDWPFSDAAFVSGDSSIDFVADDGARRGDGAPVLVAHTTAGLARVHLDNPDGCVPSVVAALSSLLGVGEPDWTSTHRWTFAKPAGQHDSSFGLLDLDGRPVGLAGDQWCPSGSPRVESAWRSGTDVAEAIAARL